MKRILIADDHEAVRSGLRAVLEQRADWEVVAEANDGGKAVAAAIESRPHVAILDFSMPHMTVWRWHVGSGTIRCRPRF